jgi:predicted neutral ceramidase superfamily lipid hydrolase
VTALNGHGAASHPFNPAGERERDNWCKAVGGLLQDAYFRHNKAQTFFPYLAITTIIYTECAAPVQVRYVL